MSTLETTAAHWDETRVDIGSRPTPQAVGILAARAADLLSESGEGLPHRYHGGFAG